MQPTTLDSPQKCIYWKGFSFLRPDLTYEHSTWATSLPAYLQNVSQHSLQISLYKSQDFKGWIFNLQHTSKGFYITENGYNKYGCICHKSDLCPSILWRHYSNNVLSLLLKCALASQLKFIELYELIWLGCNHCNLACILNIYHHSMVCAACLHWCTCTMCRSWSLHCMEAEQEIYYLQVICSVTEYYSYITGLILIMPIHCNYWRQENS